MPIYAAKIETCFVYLDFSTEDKEASQEQHKNNMTQNWITRRNEQGVYNNLIEELGTEDPTGFRWYFRLSKEKFQEYLRYCNKLVLFYRCPLLDLRADLSFHLRHVGKDACSRDSHDIS